MYMLVVAENNSELTKPLTVAAKQDRIPWVYHARGIAIMLIVYRHILLGIKFAHIPVPQWMFDLQMFFFNFRMPAFFMLSGVFIVQSLRKRSEWSVAKSKVFGLLYPYVLWACITLFLQIYFHNYSNAQRDWEDFTHILTSPRSLDQLWYLMALFNASILYLLLNHVLGNRTWLHIGIAVGLHVASFYIRSFDLFSDLFYFYMYFLTGALLSGTLVTTAKREKVLNTSYIKWVIPFFVAGQIFWFIHSERTDFYEVFFVVINFIGCYFLFLCSVLLARHTTNEWLAYIGRYSLYIYILHVQIAAIVRKIIVTVFPNVNTGLLLAICFMCGIILPILIINHFKKFGIKKLFVLETEKSSRPYES